VDLENNICLTTKENSNEYEVMCRKGSKCKHSSILTSIYNTDSL
jgi:hypothetical protein